MNELLIKAVFYIVAAIFFYLGYKELYLFSKSSFKFNTKTFIGLVYIGAAIGMLATGSWIFMFLGPLANLLARLCLALDLFIKDRKSKQLEH